ncbi:MAG TPA: DUF3307 domain-containing protein [Bacillota bacterium]|nr:DUF3307 domain-containing protein [Bacillota bacterium]
MSQPFLIFVFAYLISEFLWQTEKLYEQKNKMNSLLNLPFFKNELIFHSLYYGLTVIVFLMIFQTFSLSLVLPILISLVLHYLNAYLKMHLKVRSFESKESPFFAKRMLQKHTFYFVLFQLVNIVAIYFILLIFQKVYTPYELCTSIKHLVVGTKTIDPTSKIVLVAILIHLLIFGNGQLIQNIFKDIKTKPKKGENDAFSSIGKHLEHYEQFVPVEKRVAITNSDNDSIQESYMFKFLYDLEAENVGKYIGYLERVIIGIFVVLEAYAALSLLAGFKTLTRFKQLESKSFAEYYLIGTLLSISLGLLIGLLLRFVIFS